MTHQPGVYVHLKALFLVCSRYIDKAAFEVAIIAAFN